MLENIKLRWLDLQLFADGNGGEGGEGSAASTTVANPADDGQQKLRDLGVPESILRKRQARKTTPKIASEDDKHVSSASKTAKVESQSTAADEETPQEATGTASTMSWDDFMAIPENNQRMQGVVQARLRSSKVAEENLAKLAPALEILAGQYGMDPANLDYAALSEAIGNDDKNYEELALKMGTSVEDARGIAKQQQQARKEATQSHLASLEQQGEALKQVFPGFDLHAELQNPTFARLTAPNSGLTLEDAYYAVHRKEIMTESMRAAANQTAERMSAAIQSGSRRPTENGSTGSAPTKTNFSYRNASPAERAAFKAHIRSEAARGRKVYPGG